MRVQSSSTSKESGKSFSRSSIIIGGISSVAVIAVATAGTAAYRANELEPVSNSREVKSSNSISSEIQEPKAEVSQQPVAEDTGSSYSESTDGTSNTRQYRSTTQDQNGNVTTEERTYTTDIDGGSAIDIKLNSNSSSTGSSSNGSSVQLNVQSNSRVSTSQQN